MLKYEIYIMVLLVFHYENNFPLAETCLLNGFY